MNKLKNKVFMVILSILTIFLATILIIFNYQYYYSFKNRIIKNLSRTEIMGDKFNEQNRYYLDDEIIKPKKTERKRFVPLIPRLKSRAKAKEKTLTVTTETTVNSAVKPSACKKSLDEEKALI